MKVSCPGSGMFLEAFITKDVLLVVRRLDRELEVQAWNVISKKKIYGKNFRGEFVVFDRHNQQVMVGSNTRLEITGTTVIETSQTPLPGSHGLRAFSHPNYLTRGPGGGVDTLRTLEGSKLTRVADLNTLYHLVFCPGRDFIVSCACLYPNIKVRVHSSQTGQLIKSRVLASPTAIHSIYSLQVNANQLVLLAKQQHGDQYQAVLLVFDMECILSQSADQETRIFQIGQPGFRVERIFLNKTSVSVWLRKNKFNISRLWTLDFWNCEN